MTNGQQVLQALKIDNIVKAFLDMDTNKGKMIHFGEFVEYFLLKEFDFGMFLPPGYSCEHGFLVRKAEPKDNSP